MNAMSVFVFVSKMDLLANKQLSHRGCYGLYILYPRLTRSQGSTTTVHNIID
jgi:hypothetical protein